MAKIYGKVLAIKGEAGKLFAQVESLNTSDSGTKYVVFIGDAHGRIKNSGDAARVEVGDRISVTGTIDSGLMQSLEETPYIYRADKPAQQKGGYKKRNIGMEVGHAQNGAFILSGHADFDPSMVLFFAECVADVTAAVKIEYGKANPNMDDYSVGAASGCAVLNACRSLLAEDDTDTLYGLPKQELTDQLEERTISILDNITTEITKYVTAN